MHLNTENCFHGGRAFEKHQLCNNYTSTPRIHNDKYIMDIVSGNRSGLVIAVYSFKHYSQVSVEATVTLTPCKGAFFTEGKYLCYSFNMILGLLFWTSCDPVRVCLIHGSSLACTITQRFVFQNLLVSFC